MRAGLILTLAVAGPAGAERLACTLYRDCPTGATCRQAPLELVFDLDRDQFYQPRIGNEPPARLRILVTAGATRYHAEPILMRDGTRGFHAEMPDGERLLTVTPDGAAIYTDTGEAHGRTGTCRKIAE